MIFLLVFSEFSYVELPKSMILHHGEYEISVDIRENGRINFGFDVGFFDMANAGLYYGGENIIGKGDIVWDSVIDPHFKIGYLGAEEGFLNIAGGYTRTTNFFLEAGKVLDIYIGLLEFDVGIFYLSGLSFFSGMELLVAENTGIDVDFKFGREKDYTVALKWGMEDVFYFKFIMKNLFSENWEREITIGFVNSF